MKRLSIFLLLLAAVLTANAIPAEPGLWRTMKLANGKQVTVQLRGDEFLHYWEAKDGACYTQIDNELQPADMNALRARSLELRAQDAVTGPMRAQGANRVAQRATFQGTKKCLILLVQFSDVKFSMDDPKTYYNRVANEKGLSEGNFVGCVADYFRDQSRGEFEIDFDVRGPYTLGSSASYGANDASGNDVNARGMVTEACNKAYAEGVDFTPYDWTGNGYVEEVYVIYAGRGEATGGDASTIWPHKWALSSPLSVGSKRVQVYACSNELRTATSLMGIGTICHEFSHCLGYPDMYDTRGNSGATNTFYGMGNWDLMCSGSYNGGEFVPAGYTAYEKMVAGWVEPEELDQNCTVTDMVPTADGGKTYKFTNPGNPNEYYIIENRQKKGWDAALGGAGILINHIDYNASFWNTYNNVNTPSYGNDHERITIIPADNVKSTQTEAGDAWPYGLNNTLSTTTTPACTAYNANNGMRLMNISISNMKVEGGVASFIFTNLNNGASQEGYLLNETFTRCQGTGGNDEAGFTPPMLAQNFAVGTFTPDVEGWTGSFLRGAFQCARVGRSTAANSNTVTSPVLTLGTNESAKVTFLAAPYGSDKTGLVLSADNDATLSQTQFTMTNGEWTSFETILTGSGDVKLTFAPEGRMFLDEVQVVSTTASGIEDIAQPTRAPRRLGVYSLEGVYLGVDAESLPHGIYIINGRKVIK